MSKQETQERINKIIESGLIGDVSFSSGIRRRKRIPELQSISKTNLLTTQANLLQISGIFKEIALLPEKPLISINAIGI